MTAYFGRHYCRNTVLVQTNLTNRVDLQTLRVWYIVLVIGPYKLDLTGTWN